MDTDKTIFAGNGRARTLSTLKAENMSATSPRPSPPFINGGEGENSSGDRFVVKSRPGLGRSVGMQL